ncbi:MAG: BMP family ABC transporter substrate-binding protein [Candidatus Accumulibacter sp.]|jgi:basic membrane protein A|nr:BMP family ABC transporter substrate-binding protein [Accumulibacter sp.]
MKSAKTFFLLVLFLSTIAGIVVTGCGRRVDAWRPGLPMNVEKIKVGVLYPSDPFSEPSGFCHEHHEGIKAMQKALALADDQLLVRVDVLETDQAAIEYNARELVLAGAHVIFGASGEYMPVFEELAAEYPDRIFLHANGYKYNDTNFSNYYGRIHQARYLSGIVAGLRTRTNKVGFVAAMGMENSQVSSGLDAFAMGVESVNPKARVYVRVVHNWFDPAIEALNARLLIEDGCDVITHHTDTPAPLEEAQRAGVWAIGFNSDMSHEAPEAVMTSVVWHWDVYYTYLMKSVLDGTFSTIPYFGGIQEGLVGLSPLNEKLAAPGTAEAVAAAERRMRDDGFNVFDGVMETNDGRRVGTAGGAFTNVMIMRDVTWYYRNVILR